MGLWHISSEEEQDPIKLPFPQWDSRETEVHPTYIAHMSFTDQHPEMKLLRQTRKRLETHIVEKYKRSMRPMNGTTTYHKGKETNQGSLLDRKQGQI